MGSRKLFQETPYGVEPIPLHEAPPPGTSDGPPNGPATAVQLAAVNAFQAAMFRATAALSHLCIWDAARDLGDDTLMFVDQDLLRALAAINTARESLHVMCNGTAVIDEVLGSGGERINDSAVEIGGAS